MGSVLSRLARAGFEISGEFQSVNTEPQASGNKPARMGEFLAGFRLLPNVIIPNSEPESQRFFYTANRGLFSQQPATPCSRHVTSLPKLSAFCSLMLSVT
jgi:hypothetical protein